MTVNIENTNANVIMLACNDRTMVTCTGSKNLYIYNIYGMQCSTIKLRYRIYDVTLTPGGNIVYTTCLTKKLKYSRNKVVTTNMLGEKLAEKTMTLPLCLSVSEDKNIYLADGINGVYESQDDGFSWNLLFKLPNGSDRCWQTIKVLNSLGENIFWTLLKRNDKQYYLELFSFGAGSEIMKYEDIDQSSLDLSVSKLAYNGKDTILLATYKNNSVFSIPTYNQKDVKRLSFDEQLRYIRGINFDPSKQLLYVCCTKVNKRPFIGHRSEETVQIFNII